MIHVYFSVAISAQTNQGPIRPTQTLASFADLKDMAPKGVKRLKPPPQSSRPCKGVKTEPAVAAGLPNQGYVTQTMNKHMVKVHSCIEIVFNNEHFTDIKAMPPLSIKDGARRHRSRSATC